MNTQADRVMLLMKERQVPKRKVRSALADACGITYQSVTDWFDGSTKTISGHHLAAIARKWNADLDWLISGTGKMDRLANGVANVAEVGVGYATGKRQAPVISWVQAGEWNDIMDEFQPGHAEEWEPVPDTASQYCFWLRVVGDSMTATAGVSIPEGALILVDPETPVVSGCLVVAKLIDSDQATFKRYIEDAGHKYLKPLNPAYPVIEVNGNCRIVGVVKEAKIKL